MELNPNVFREYDIRGIVNRDLTEEFVYLLGKGCGTYFCRHRVRKIALGRDCRLSSPSFRNRFIEGITETGCHVIDVGVVPTPLLYFALFNLNVKGGIQITGSHNPPDYNGFKVCLGASTIYGEEIQKVRHIMELGEFVKGKGHIEERDIASSYKEYLLNHLSPGSVNRRVVVDAGNGTGGVIAVPLYREMGFEVIPLFCEPDGHFPNHHPDPTVPENMKPLIERVASDRADLGIAFDGDTDRIGVVDESGTIIWGDQLMVIFSRSILKDSPGATFIAEVKCSQTLFDDIAKNGGNPIMWKVGHSLIKAKMKEEGALLAGEMSGHIFFADRYFGYDDAIYAGARLLEILSNTRGSLSGLLSDIPKMVNTPEIRMECSDDKKFHVVSELAHEFKREYRVIDIDGVRVLFPDGWGLVRASNTQPVLVLRFEASSQESLRRIQDLVMEKLKSFLE
jgi:phosphomannomutase/phosphoglucomutase